MYRKSPSDKASRASVSPFIVAEKANVYRQCYTSCQANSTESSYVKLTKYI